MPVPLAYVWVWFSASMCGCDALCCSLLIGLISVICWSLDLRVDLFAVWSRSFRLFLGGKGKTGWILGHRPKSATSDPTYPQWDIDNCTILGWLFNSIKDMITFSMEELEQYEPLSDFPTEAATIVSQRLAHFKTLLPYHPYMGHLLLLMETSVVVAYSRLCLLPLLLIRWLLWLPLARVLPLLVVRLLALQPLLQALSATPIADQMAFVAFSSSGPPSSSGKTTCSTASTPGFVCYPLLLIKWLLWLSLARVLPLLVVRLLAPTMETLAILESGVLSFIQNYESKFLSEKGRHYPSGSTATLATGTAAFYAKTGHPTWVLNFGANDHMTGTPSLPDPDATTISTNLDGLPRPIPLFDSPPV
ncbi:hypothetical protein Acr_00g0008420 [Actinidia rufa]|uniref:Uncharacterized protein n=1 Tax=Actinidia rufa TaxID=165716 RepID=A0A7J0DA26_9ERIC|nr:hypothetical protein Acr_00g0008420 [Actinidia rufa]